MKLKEPDIIELMAFFEESMNRGARIDKQRKLQLRRKIRNELYALMGWELATPEAVMSRWEERLDEVFRLMPYGFKDDLFKVIAEKLQGSRVKRHGLAGEPQTNRP